MSVGGRRFVFVFLFGFFSSSMPLGRRSAVDRVFLHVDSHVYPPHHLRTHTHTQKKDSSLKFPMSEEKRDVTFFLFTVLLFTRFLFTDFFIQIENRSRRGKGGRRRVILGRPTSLDLFMHTPYTPYTPERGYTRAAP